MHEVYTDEDYRLQDEELQATVLSPQYRNHSSATISSDSRSPSPEGDAADPGLSVLFASSGLNTALERFGRAQKGSDCEMVKREGGAGMPAEDAPQRPGISTVQGPDAGTAQTPVDSAVDLKHVHSDASDARQFTADIRSGGAELATRSRVDRVDSANANGPSSPKTTPFTKPAPKSPLKVITSSQPVAKDSIQDSPTLSKHTLTSAEQSGVNIPPYEPTSPSVASPQNAKLPSFRQLTGSLTELAEAATAEMRPHPTYSHHHSRSFGSATSQSPVLSHHYPPSIQPSPQAYYAPSVSARSPTSTISEHQHYGSPPTYPLYSGGFAHRRPSVANDTPPTLPPSLPSASSSGESHGYPGSITDGYSTSHTTPTDGVYVPDSMPRPLMHPMLPPQNGMPPGLIVPGPFQCEVPGCSAGTFQTQYLLSSHKNVHSHSRPHYCPVEGCPRAEGGKGFKRKNEMIRHGLVHNSPGYICPFCPEKEHRYPRPDNLQRHVRVHHVDKDKDDQQLREVLNQRIEGQGKTRRRRTGAGGAIDDGHAM